MAAHFKMFLVIYFFSRAKQVYLIQCCIKSSSCIDYHTISDQWRWNVKNVNQQGNMNKCSNINAVLLWHFAIDISSLKSNVDIAEEQKGCKGMVFCLSFAPLSPSFHNYFMTASYWEDLMFQYQCLPFICFRYPKEDVINLTYHE